MPKFLRLVATAAMLVIAAQSFCRHAVAQSDPSYPSRAVKVIVSAPPGGGVDIVARVIADRLAKLWGQPFVVENRPGAGGNLGAEAVAQAEPDGYTILAAQPAPLTTNVVLYKKLNFDPAAFEPLAIMTTIPNTLVVRADFPANSVQELIAYAKANPGKVNFGSQGVGTTPHLTGELFARVTAVKLTHVPYRGTAQAVNDLVAGHLDLLFFQLELRARAIPGEEGEDAGGDDRGARRRRARGSDHGRSRRQEFSLRHLERAGRAAAHPGGDRGQAQCRDQRGAQAAGDGGASARHEHDADRRRAGRDQAIHPGGDRALGRRDPRGRYPRGLATAPPTPSLGRSTWSRCFSCKLTGRKQGPLAEATAGCSSAVAPGQAARTRSHSFHVAPRRPRGPTGTATTILTHFW